MAFYRSLRSAPELSTLSKDRLMEVWRECGYRTTPLYGRLLVAFIICVGVLSFKIILRFQSGSYFLAIGKSAIFAELLTFFFAFACRSLTLHMQVVLSLPGIRKYLGGLCTKCGYDMRATP
jgi:hypothetical protein